MQTSDIMQTRELRLVNGRGELRAVLAVDSSEDVPYLNLYGSDGVPRIAMSVQPSGTPHVVLWQNTKIVASIGMGEDGAGVTVHDRDGRPRILLHFEDDDPVIETLDADGNTLWESPAATV